MTTVRVGWIFAINKQNDSDWLASFPFLSICDAFDVSSIDGVNIAVDAQTENVQ